MSTVSTDGAPHREQPDQRQTRSVGGASLSAAPLGKLVATDVRPGTVLIETVLLPLLMLVLGFWLSPDDPLWVHGHFQWAWLAPVLVALRHGPLPGLGAGAVLLLAWLGFNHDQDDVFPQAFFLGGAIIVMLVGQFSSMWMARTRRAETVQKYLHQQMEHLVRQYYLLRLSHDRLEQELIGRPMSMRDALKSLRGLGEGAADAQTLLELVAQYCQISAATLYRKDGLGLATEPLATIGHAISLLPNDPLVRQALETRRLCHVAQVSAVEQGSHYLVAAPLLDLGGEVYGLLLVDDMPFFSVKEENLQTINLLLGYYSDGLSMRTLAQPLQQVVPDCPQAFAFEMQRLWNMQARAGVPSVIVALEFSSQAVARNLPQQMLRLRRLVDESWLITGHARQVLVVLMPLGDAGTAEGFLVRMENWIQQKEGCSLAAAGVFPHQFLLSEAAPLAMLQRLIGLADA